MLNCQKLLPVTQTGNLWIQMINLVATAPVAELFT